MAVVLGLKSLNSTVTSWIAFIVVPFHIFVHVLSLCAQPRMVEDYYDNMPSDVVESVDKFDTHFVDWMSSSYVLSAQEVSLFSVPLCLYLVASCSSKEAP